MISVQALHVYPVKGLGGLSPPRARVSDRGFEGDRRFMVVDADGRFLSQRTLPQMAMVAASMEGPALRLATPGRAPLEVPLRPRAGPARVVEVWRDRCEALSAGPEAARWLSEVLGLACELVYMPEATVRPVKAQYGPGRVGFADAYPFLLASASSLADLARRGADVPMARFRPNIVVEGAPAWAEDGWRRLRVGSVAFRVAKPCERCVVTTVDPARGAYAGPEPLRTLATFRRTDDGVLFGVNLVHEGEGTIAVGDPVELEAG